MSDAVFFLWLHAKHKLSVTGSHPGKSVPKGFQRSALEMAEPPMGKSQLQQEENDTHTQTDCRTAVLVQSQSVTEI